MTFHALGMNDLGDGVIDAFIADVNNVESKGRGGFTNRPEDMFKFKVPQLYNLRDVKFLGHGSNFSSIQEILEYKNRAVAENLDVPMTQLSSDFVPLKLSKDDLNLLRIFLEKSLFDPNLDRYVPIALPSGNCFPNADFLSKDDLNCN